MNVTHNTEFSTHYRFGGTKVASNSVDSPSYQLEDELMTTWTRLATVALTAAGLAGLGNRAAAQCVTYHSGTPTMIVLANPLSTQPAPTSTTTAHGTTSTTQGTTTTTSPGTTSQVTPAGGIILSDGRIVPASGVAGTAGSYTPGSYSVDGNGNPVYPHQFMGSPSYYPSNGMYSNGYFNGSGMYAGSPYLTYSDYVPERPRRGLLRRR